MAISRREFLLAALMGTITATAGAVRHGRAKRKRPRPDAVDVSRYGLVSAAQFTTVDPSAAGDVSVVEFACPSPTNDRYGSVSYAQLEVPAFTSPDRSGRISALQFDTPVPERSGRVSAVQFEIGAATKPVAAGVFTRKGPVPAATEPVRIPTIDVLWSEVEPTQGNKSSTSIFADLDLAEARGFEGCRVRVFTGKDAPSWALNIGSGPITYIEPQNDINDTIPDIWDTDYQAAVESLYAWLATELDADPRVKLVFAAGAMTYYAEPFIRGLSNADNRTALLAAGYTRALDQAAQLWQLDIMTGFTETPIGLAYNPHQYINTNGGISTDLPYMGVVMDYHIELFGERAVLQNNSIRSSYIASPPAMYQYFRDRPQAAHQFQCARTAAVGDEAATIQWAIDYLDATGIEHSNTLTDAQYEAFDAALVANQ